MRELTVVPDRGWAIDREEGNVGMSCVAAPIFAPLGHVVAALSLTGPASSSAPTGSAPRSGSRRPPRAGHTRAAAELSQAQCPVSGTGDCGC